MRRGHRHVTLLGLIQAAAVLTVVFSFVTGFDIPHRNVELFSHFRLQYFVASVLLLLAFAILRNPVYSIALLVTAIFNASFVLPWYFGDAARAPGTQIKLMHANVYHSNKGYQRFIDLVREEDPDMIFVQEFTAEWVNNTASLSQDYPHAYFESRRGRSGVAMYSKLPLESVGHIDSPPLNYATIITKASVDGVPLTLITTHPTIPIGRESYAARNLQLQSVAEIVSQTAGNVVLLGDFNASLWCAHYRKLESTSGLTSARKGFGILPSWPVYLPFAMIPIDHVLVSDGISVIDLRTGKRIGSDHLPLFVTISMN